MAKRAMPTPTSWFSDPHILADYEEIAHYNGLWFKIYHTSSRRTALQPQAIAFGTALHSNTLLGRQLPSAVVYDEPSRSHVLHMLSHKVGPVVWGNVRWDLLYDIRPSVRTLRVVLAKILMYSCFALISEGSLLFLECIPYSRKRKPIGGKHVNVNKDELRRMRESDTIARHRWLINHHEGWKCTLYALGMSILSM